MKKIYSLMIALLSTGVVMAQHNVTFRVDLGTTTVSPNGVHVAGDFQMAAGAAANWDPAATSLTNVSGSIYEVQVNIPNGIYQFKFINDNDWPGVESVPAPVQVDLGNGNDNRWINISGDTVLAAIMFGGAAPSGMHALTTRVDLTLEASVDDTISLAGNFVIPNWSPGSVQMTDINGDSIYSHIAYVAPGTMAEWKFVNGADWAFGETVPSSCAVNSNRGITVNSDTVYSGGAVCFGQCASCFIPDTGNVTINVDMSGVCGWTSDSVDFAGPFNGWGGGDFLTDPDNDGIYSITVRVAGPEFKYKARYIQGGSANWEGGADKIVNFVGDTVVTVRCFGADAPGACAPLPAPADISFRVDVSTFPNQADLNDIYLIGDFTNPQWQGGKTLMTPVAGMPGVFETTIANVCPGKIAFKFMNVKTDATEQEEGFIGLVDSSCTEPSGTGSLNRFFVRPDANPQMIDYKWDKCESIIGLNEQFASRLIDVYPNPFTGSTTVSLEENETYIISLRDLTGKEIFSDEASGEYSLKAGNITSGVYLLSITNTQGETNVNKVIVQ